MADNYRYISTSDEEYSDYNLMPLHIRRNKNSTIEAEELTKLCDNTLKENNDADTSSTDAPFFEENGDQKVQNKHFGFKSANKEDGQVHNKILNVKSEKEERKHSVLVISNLLRNEIIEFIFENFKSTPFACAFVAHSVWKVVLTQRKLVSTILQNPESTHNNCKISFYPWRNYNLYQIPQSFYFIGISNYKKALLNKGFQIKVIFRNQDNSGVFTGQITFLSNTSFYPTLSFWLFGYRHNIRAFQKRSKNLNEIFAKRRIQKRKNKESPADVSSAAIIRKKI